jgi:RHS repeat-associated protein
LRLEIFQLSDKKIMNNHPTSSRFDLTAILMRALEYVPSVVSMLAMLITVVAKADAQNIQYTEGSTNSKTSLNSEVDPSSLGLSFRLVLTNYPGRKSLDTPVILQYSSKDVWHLDYSASYDRYPDMPGVISTLMEATFRHGWEINLKPPTISFENTNFDTSGNAFDLTMKDAGGPYFYVPRMRIKMPDGISHEFRKGDWMYDAVVDQPVPSWVWSGIYYSVDGSRMRFDYNTSTLYLPDGSKYIFNNVSFICQSFVDRNGNTRTFDSANNRWTDTLGRLINLPQLSPVSPQDNSYSLAGVNNSSISYVLKWRFLSDTLTDPQQPLRYRGDCLNVTQTTPSVSPSLFQSGMPYDYVCDPSQMPFNPVVLSEIALPNGTSYKFSYNVWGEIDKIVYPSGGYERFRYDIVQGTSYVSAPYAQTNRGVVERWISADGTPAGEVRWQYSSTIGAYQVTSETAPDNTRIERLFNAASGTPSLFGLEDSKVGKLAEERVYDSAGTMVRRLIKDYQVTSAISERPAGTVLLTTANRNAVPIKEAEILLDPGTSLPLVTTTTYELDSDLNVRFMRKYNFAQLQSRSDAETLPINSLPQGGLLRTTEYSYVTGGAYANFTGLMASTRVTDGSGSFAALTEYRYDESPLQTYMGQYVGWTDPGTVARGNVTTIRGWNDPTSFVETHSTYDQFGNMVSATDARGGQSFVEYSTTYKYAYPTATTSAVADPSGVHGSASALVSTAVYDFTTGLVTTSTDPNGQVISFDYTDALNRIKTVTRPVGGGTTVYTYGDAPSNLYVRTQTALDASRSIDTYQYFDGLRRPSRSFLNEEGTYITSDTQYDSMGRVWRTSNPYRTTSLSDPINPSNIWTTNSYDPLGRVISVTSPDGAMVTAAYGQGTNALLATVVSVTDQAGRSKRSFGDALGRLVRVDEPDKDSGALGSIDSPIQSTSYSYDALDNLTGVTQGVQNRTFVYDSLKRLRSATNPEGGTVSYDYDNNGNLKSRVDARGWTTTIDYDALNRPTAKTYTGTGNAMVPVNYYYDNASLPAGAPANFDRGHSLGRLVAVIYGSSGSSEGNYSGYDELGRVKESQQVTDGRSYKMNYSYDLAGNLETETYPSGRVVKSNYDTAGRLAGVKNQLTSAYYAGAVATDDANRMQYAPSGALTAVKLGNGLWEHTILNSRLQPQEIGLGSTSTNSTVLQLQYDYGASDNNGNVHSQTISVGSSTFVQTYGYDKLNRLKTASETPSGGTGWQQTFTYDRYGNRRFDAANTTSELASQNPTISLSNNRVDGCVYDLVGNVTTDLSGNVMAYDAENHMTSFNGSNGLWNYSYDGDGRRVKKAISLGTDTTIFVYDAMGRLAAEYANNNPINHGTSYLTADHLGSTRVVTDSTGAVKGRYDYLPFGEQVSAIFGNRSSIPGYNLPSDSERQKFLGKERDSETGLNFFEARYYSSEQGRFTSADPVYFQITMAFDPQRFNLFSYGRNNPLKFVDPDGERVRLLGDTRWLYDHVLYAMVGGEETFNQYFIVEGDEVRLRPNVDISKANEGVQELAGYVNAEATILYFAGTNGMEAASLFGSTGGQQAALARQFEDTVPNTSGNGGTIVRTQGRTNQNSLEGPSVTFEDGTTAFAIIAFNTNAVLTQNGGTADSGIARDGMSVDPKTGVIVEFAEQWRGRGQVIAPVRLFIHESAENLAFANQARAGTPLDANAYGEAHRYAMRREGAVRRALQLPGGFAGAAIKQSVPRRGH